MPRTLIDWFAVLTAAVVFVPCGLSAQNAGPPLAEIYYATPITPKVNQTITIYGTGFGSMPAFYGNSPSIFFGDLTAPAGAGGISNAIGLKVSSWTDSRIIIKGFTSMPTPTWLSKGDTIAIIVSNAQSLGYFSGGKGSICNAVVGSDLPCVGPR